jgi:hypothetical protein
MNETFQIYFATSVRSSNCDLGEGVVRHLDVGPTELGICQGEGERGAFAPSNFWSLWKKKLSPPNVLLWLLLPPEPLSNFWRVRRACRWQIAVAVVGVVL